MTATATATATATVRPDGSRGDVVVRPLAVDDDREVAAAHAAMTASRAHERPWAQVMSLRELVVDLRSPSTMERLEPWVVLVDGEVAGLAMLWFPLLDNLAFVWGEVDVDPRLRRRGAGGALVRRLVERTREEGRRTVLIESHVPDDAREDHPHVRFAERHGFAWANTEIVRLLDLPVDPTRLAQLAADASVRHAGLPRGVVRRQPARPTCASPTATARTSWPSTPPPERSTSRPSRWTPPPTSSRSSA